MIVSAANAADEIGLTAPVLAQDWQFTLFVKIEFFFEGYACITGFTPASHLIAFQTEASFPSRSFHWYPVPSTMTALERVGHLLTFNNNRTSGFSNSFDFLRSARQNQNIRCFHYSSQWKFASILGVPPDDVDSSPTQLSDVAGTMSSPSGTATHLNVAL